MHSAYTSKRLGSWRRCLQLVEGQMGFIFLREKRTIDFANGQKTFVGTNPLHLVRFLQGSTYASYLSALKVQH
eukprot:12889024-Prorocentrum_lima.AAC.1